MTDPISAITDWLTQYDGAEIFWTLAGILTVLGLLWKWAKRALPVVKKTIAFLEAQMALPTFMQRMESFSAATAVRMDVQEGLIKEVRHEVLPNNGGSMRDTFDTLNLKVDKLEARQQNDYLRMEEMQQQIQVREARRSAAEERRQSNIGEIDLDG